MTGLDPGEDGRTRGTVALIVHPVTLQCALLLCRAGRAVQSDQGSVMLAKSSSHDQRQRQQLCPPLP